MDNGSSPASQTNHVSRACQRPWLSRKQCFWKRHKSGVFRVFICTLQNMWQWHWAFLLGCWGKEMKMLWFKVIWSLAELSVSSLCLENGWFKILKTLSSFTSRSYTVWSKPWLHRKKKNTWRYMQSSCSWHRYFNVAPPHYSQLFMSGIECIWELTEQGEIPFENL